MKKRISFISNSSSCSFIIPIDKVNEELLHKIINPDYSSQTWGLDSADQWTIEVNENLGLIEGYTFVDNFDMYRYFKEIGVPDEIVKWGE